MKSIEDRNFALKLLESSTQFIIRQAEELIYLNDDQSKNRFFYFSAPLSQSGKTLSEHENIGSLSKHDDRVVVARAPFSLRFIRENALVPILDLSIEHITNSLVERKLSIAATNEAGNAGAITWITDSGCESRTFSMNIGGRRTVATSKEVDMATGVYNMACTGFIVEIPEANIMNVFGIDIEAKRMALEIGVLNKGHHPLYTSEYRERNKNNLLDEYVRNNLSTAKAVSRQWRAYSNEISIRTGLSAVDVEELSNDLSDLIELRAKGQNQKYQTIISWVDLSKHGYYLGDQKMIDGKSRLILLDMKNTADWMQLEKIGFKKVKGSPKYEEGIFYLNGDDQRLKPKLLATALGLEDCPIIRVPIREVENVFKEKILEKFGANIRAITQRSIYLGKNKDGEPVYDSPTGRYISISKNNAISENSSVGVERRKSAFLRVENDLDLSDCAEAFVQGVEQGLGQSHWQDLVQYAGTIYGPDKANDSNLYQLQEALEAAAYSRFSQQFRTGSADLHNPEEYKKSVHLYYGIPASRLRTGESINLQQYSTPLPLSFVAQRLLIGNDKVDDKLIWEPTAGNGGLLNVLPTTAKIKANELDENRYRTLRRNKEIEVSNVDAVTADYLKIFNLDQGFDFTIANPPFGSMSIPKAFDKLKQVKKVDHYISLKTLAARKDNGRSVFIFGADNAYSKGEVKGSTKAFLEWVMDHYEVHGLTQIDGRLYQRQGAGYDVRLMVVGKKRELPKIQPVPEILSVISDYESLWKWSTDTINKYDKNMSNEIGDNREIYVSTDIVGSQTALFDPDKNFKSAMSYDEQISHVKEAIEKLEWTRGPEFYGVIEDANGDLPELYMPNDDNKFAQIMGDRVEKYGQSYALQFKFEKSEFRYRVIKSLYPNGYGVGSQWAADPDSAYLMVRDVPPVYRDPDSNIYYIKKETVADKSNNTQPQKNKLLDKIKEKLVSDNSSTVERKDQGNILPSGWTEAYKGGIATNQDPIEGGIVDELLLPNRNGKRWFVIPQNDHIPKMENFETREAAFAALAEAVSLWKKRQVKILPNSDAEKSSESAIDGRTMNRSEKSHKALTESRPRIINEFQVPYQSSSKVGEPSTMIPINMATSTYAALNDLESEFGSVDEYVSRKLSYKISDIEKYYSPEQIDAIALAIKSTEEGRGIINADQTGIGKGRFVASMLRYAKINKKTPIFITIKPELFTDLFRDIDDIGSGDIFKNVFIFNNDESIKKFGTESEILYQATSNSVRQEAIESGRVGGEVDLVVATYSQFMREAIKNPKARLLVELASQNAMLVLDEAHVASGASNVSKIVGDAVANSKSVIYASATPLKGISNFHIYNKVFPASVDLELLPLTLSTGGEALQEAVSSNMSRDGVLIRREHDFSKLEFITRHPREHIKSRNVDLANRLSEIIAAMSILSGDVKKEVASLNKKYEKTWQSIPEDERKGSRMQASSMNFGSRLYNINRQFLLGLKIDDAVEAALEDLSEGRKPVIAVENTGESLLREVITRRAGVDALEAELLEIEESTTNTPVVSGRREYLISQINNALRNVELDEPPQFRELLDSILTRISVIKTQERYGEYARSYPSSEGYKEREEVVRKMISEFPDLSLTPIDSMKYKLSLHGYTMAEVSGRTVSISKIDGINGKWVVKFHKKADAVSNVAGFQNGKYDAIVITRSGSTGISLHATDRFRDSDIRQRNFIVLQKAANIAEFLQWMGRVNRKDQVVYPLITSLESGLPAELRLTMMHNAKLRKLSANTTSNRDNANLEGEDFDLLNEVGESIALAWLVDNPDVADALDIDLPDEDEVQRAGFTSDFPFINKLMGRLMMVNVKKQENILKLLSDRFKDRVHELEHRGENPFKVDVYDWRAIAIKEEELSTGSLQQSKSSFDEPVKLVTLSYDQDIRPMRSFKLQELLKRGVIEFESDGIWKKYSSLAKFRDEVKQRLDQYVREQLPKRFRDKDETVESIIENNRKETVRAEAALARGSWLVNAIYAFKPGATVVFEDNFRGEMNGVVVGTTIPDAEEIFLLSKYKMNVAFPGEEDLKNISLATLFSQGHSLNEKTSNIHYDVKSWHTPIIESVYAEFDSAPSGKIKRIQHVLTGNVFRACEMAAQQHLGSPIMYTDSNGNRHRVVRVREHVTPELIKSIPLAFDHEDLIHYIHEYSKRDLECREPMKIFGRPVRDLKAENGLVIAGNRLGTVFQLSIPGTKAMSGKLMADGSIFEVGQSTHANGLRLPLVGNRKVMTTKVSIALLPALLSQLQENGHVSKFYVPDVDQNTINSLKERLNSKQDAVPEPT